MLSSKILLDFGEWICDFRLTQSSEALQYKISWESLYQEVNTGKASNLAVS
jgi:hypothetical protein